MKKLLLLPVFCMFVQVRSEVPEMTETQQRELDGIDHIIPKYLDVIRLKLMNTIPGKVQSDTRIGGKTILNNGTEIETKKYVIEKNDSKVTFTDKEVDSYDALKRMIDKDCQDTNMFTGALNPANVKACTALRNMLKAAGPSEHDFGFAILDAVVSRPVNSL